MANMKDTVKADEKHWVWITENCKIVGNILDWNVKNIYKEQFCSKNIWIFGTKTLPLHHISQINNFRLWNLVNFTSYSKNMGGEKMEVAGTNITCILTTITSSRWADTLRKKYRKGLSIKCWRMPESRNNERTWSNTIPLYCQGWFLNESSWQSL